MKIFKLLKRFKRGRGKKIPVTYKENKRKNPSVINDRLLLEREIRGSRVRFFFFFGLGVI